MRIAPPFWPSFRVATAATLILLCVPACKPAAPPSGPPKAAAPKAKAPVLATNQLSAQYVSVFEDLMPPKGRDPFFPNSHRRDPVPVVARASADRPPPASEVVLKGIVGAPNHRMAVINNLILEVGESGSVRVPGGRLKVKCLEIGEDSALVQVEGEIEAKHLELKKKGN